MTAAPRPWVVGSKAPVTEELTVTDLAVTGSLPPELDGRYLRNGPNPVTAVDEGHHWFLGSGMVHGVRLRDGRAEWYRNRWVRDPDVAAALGESPPPSPFGAEVPAFAANTHVIGHAGTTLACVEAGAPPVALTDELETIGPTDLGGTLEHPFSAHTKRDPSTGELHVAAYWWGWGDRCRYLVVGTDGTVRRTVDLDLPGQPMMHDLAITERSVVLFDLPCTFDLEVAMSGRFPYRWNPGHGARVGLLPRDGEADDVRWFEVEPCYVFHPVNAYDTPEGRVVVDLVRWPRMFDTVVDGPGDGPSRLERWTIDPSSGSVTEETLGDRPLEFPRVDERLVGRRHRYGYSLAVDMPAPATAGLRHDFEQGTTEVHDFGRGKVPSELVFVPSSPDAAEDDGWLMGLVSDEVEGTAELVVLAAQDFSGEPVARVHLPQRVPEGFHGSWVPSS